MFQISSDILRHPQISFPYTLLHPSFCHLFFYIFDLIDLSSFLYFLELSFSIIYFISIFVCIMCSSICLCFFSRLFFSLYFLLFNNVFSYLSLFYNSRILSDATYSKPSSLFSYSYSYLFRSINNKLFTAYTLAILKVILKI